MGRGDGNIKKEAARIGKDDIPKLVKDLKTQPQEAKEQVAHLLDALAMQSTDHPLAMVNAGAIPPLVGLLESGTDGGQIHAASAIATIASVTKKYDSIVKAGAIKPLVMLLRMGSQRAQTYAAAAIASVSEQTSNKGLITRAGAISPLVRLVRSSVSVDAQVHASNAIANLSAENPDAQNAIYAAGAVPLLLVLLESGKAQVSAANALAQLLTPGVGEEPKPPNILPANTAIQEAIANEGGIALLLSLLNGMNTQGQVHAAAALSNLARGNKSTQDQIVKAGGIGPLLQMLPSNVTQAQAQAASALAQLARFNQANQDMIAKSEGLPLLVQLLANVNGLVVQAMAALAVAELCRNNVGNQTTAADLGAISSLVVQVRGGISGQGTDHVKAEAAGAIWVLSQDHIQNKISIAGAGGISPIINLLATGSTRGQAHAANALASLGYQNIENQCQIATLLVGLLGAGSPEAKSNAAASLWRLVEENPSSQDWVAKAGPTSDLISLLKDGTEEAKGCEERKHLPPQYPSFDPILLRVPHLLSCHLF